MVMYEDRSTLESSRLGRAPALCIFSSDTDEQLKQLSRGDRIIIEGTLAASSLHGELLGTKLYQCKLHAE